MHGHTRRGRPWLLASLSFVVIGHAACGGSSSATPTAPTPTTTLTFTINDSYGTLRFKGDVARDGTTSNYQFRAHLQLTFDKTATTNRVDSISLRTMRLVATQYTDLTGPVTLLYLQDQPISAQFTNDGDTRQLPEVTFTIPKSIAALATHVGLGVTDGALLWPIPDELK